MVSIVIISITVLILSSIIMVCCCYVKRKRGKEISNADGIGLQEIDSKYSNHLFVQILITSVLRFCKLYEIITNTYSFTYYIIDTIEIEGRSFPAGIVIKWSELKMESVIGEGNFGKVHQGYLHLNEIQR